MAIHISRLGKSDQHFTYFDEQSGEQFDFATTRLARYAKATNIEVFRSEIDAKHVRLVVEQRGIEPHRLERLTPEQIAEPVLNLLWTDGSVLMVDGHHRYVQRFQLGLTDYDFYAVPEKVWRRFMIQGVPRMSQQELLASFSHIT